MMAILAAAFLAAPGPQCEAGQGALWPVGSWRLVSAASINERTGRDDAPYGRSPAGMLIYTCDGKVSVMISHGEREALATADRAAAPPEERARACVEAGKVHTIVVYKVDRLTRALSAPSSTSTIFAK